MQTEKKTYSLITTSMTHFKRCESRSKDYRLIFEFILIYFNFNKEILDLLRFYFVTIFTLLQVLSKVELLSLVIFSKFTLCYRSVVNNYITTQPICIAKEIVVPSLQFFKTDQSLFGSPKLKNVETDIRRINVKHEHDGIMRRNKLLIEHILYERMKKKEFMINACLKQASPPKSDEHNILQITTK